jgi:hypothetical protein
MLASSSYKVILMDKNRLLMTIGQYCFAQEPSNYGPGCHKVHSERITELIQSPQNTERIVHNEGSESAKVIRLIQDMETSEHTYMVMEYTEESNFSN